LLVVALLIGGASMALAWGPGGNGAGWMVGGGYGPGAGGMMAGRGQGAAAGTTLTLDRAPPAVQSYVDRIDNPDLAVDEVLEFQDNFYTIVKEKGTGVGAFEVLVNKSNGAVFPEYGPNMMWNAKYGMMGQNSVMGQRMGYTTRTGAMTVTANQANQIPQ